MKLVPVQQFRRIDPSDADWWRKIRTTQIPDGTLLTLAVILYQYCHCKTLNGKHTILSSMNRMSARCSH